MRDLLLRRELSNDMDVIVAGDNPERLVSLAQEIGKKLGLECVHHAGMNVELRDRSTGKTIDVHYPTKTVELGLAYCEYTLSSVGFVWNTKSLCDPFGGLKDLQDKRLVLHSPQYVLSNPRYFPRLFRIAATLGFEMQAEVLSLLRRFYPLVSNHAGVTDLKPVNQLLQFLSMPAPGKYLNYLHQCGGITGLFPELEIANAVQIDAGTFLDRNVAAAADFLVEHYATDAQKFLNFEIAPKVTHLGLIRLMLMFTQMGRAYYDFKPDAPYVAGVSKTPQEFILRIERNLLRHVGARLQQSTELKTLFQSAPQALAYAYSDRSEEARRTCCSNLSGASLLRADLITQFIAAHPAFN